MAEIDRNAVERGDTVQWKTRTRTVAHGLASYTTAEGVHVEVRDRASQTRRYTIPWDRVTGHWPGRAEYDRARGALTDHG